MKGGRREPAALFFWLCQNPAVARRPERKSLLDILWSRLRKEPEQKRPVAAPRPFQAISIYRGIDACTAAKRFADYRFLAKDAPQLPLVGCTMPAGCRCKYLKHKDRRTESRRLSDFGATRLGFFGGHDRRFRRGRRSNDRD
jgi:hypothetical protein